MTDIEKKALALAVQWEARFITPHAPSRRDALIEIFTEHLRTIEQHEAYKQEVSDAINDMVQRTGSNHGLYRFMLPKPDPLVEVLQGVSWYDTEITAKELRAAIEKRGGKIVWGEG